MFRGIGLRASCAFTAVERSGSTGILIGNDYGRIGVASRAFAFDFPDGARASCAFWFACDALRERSYAAGPQAPAVADALDVLRSLGFEECSTGGGCTALEFTRPDGEQCFVTNDATVPAPGEGWDVGFYDEGDGAQKDFAWYPPGALVDALVRIAAWRVG